MFYIEVALVGKVVKLDCVYGRYRKHGFGASERSYELLDETLDTLRFIQEKYPDDLRLRDACRRGGARYIAGETYRQLTKNPKLSKVLARRMLTYKKDIPFLGLWCLVNVFYYFPALGTVFAGTIRRVKYFLKRYLG
jgi:hypothetical protein